MDCNGDGKTVATKLQEALVVDVSAGAIDPAKEKLVKEEPVEVIPSNEVEPEGGANLLSKPFTSQFFLCGTSQ